MAFGKKKRRKKPHRVTDGCQNKMSKPGSVEEIEHECEIRNRKAQSRRQHFKGHLAPSGIVRVNFTAKSLGLSFSTDTQ